MDDIDEFLISHQSGLLLHLDKAASGATAESGALKYVNQTLDEWSRFAAGRKLRQPDRKERTFWFALYELEEIAEFPPQNPLDPYMGFMLKNLARVTEVLREWGQLPEEFFATRPGEEPDFDCGF